MTERSLRKYVCAITISFALACAPYLLGQAAGTGALTGTVTDTTGAVIPNVTVVVTNAGTGQSRTVTTGADGVYRVSLLPPGTYNVKFDSPGFKEDRVSGFRINVTETPVLNSKLQLGTRTEEIQVSANAETVQTTDSTVGTDIGTETVTDLPLNTRNYTNLLSLSAGANASVNNASALGKGSQAISVNGSTDESNTFQMDGVTINNSTTNQTGENGSYGSMGIPNPDAIEEFKIQTSSYDAGYGRQSGANVNVVTKSGTNEFHGTAFEFFRNSYLNANDWIYKNSQLSQGLANHPQALNQNQFGGTIGGPIKKNKVLVFISYQETQQKNGATPYGYQTGVLLPTLPAGDRSSPAFNSALGAIYCSQPTFGGLIGFGGVQVACDGSNINPVALNILNLKNPNGSYYVPAATTNGPVAYSDPAIYKEHQGIGNFDYIINQKHTLSGRYFFATDPTIAPFSSGLGFPAPGIPGNGVFTEYGNQVATLKATSVLTQSLVNEATASYQRSAVLNRELNTFTDTGVGIQPVQPDWDYLTNIWFIPVAGRVAMDLGSHPFFGQFERVNQYMLADQISWTHKKHSLRAGVEGEMDQWNWKMPSLSGGGLTFLGFSDFLLGLGSCAPGTWPYPCNAANPGGSNGTPLGNIDGSYGTRQLAGGTYHDYRSNAFDWFVTDDFRMNSRLTVNLGVRWELFGNISDHQGLQTNIYLSKVAAAGVPGNTPATGSFVGYVVQNNYSGPALPAGVVKSGNNSATADPPLTNFAPRLGFALRPFNSDQFVVRGGGGFFYNRPELDATATSLAQIPYGYTVPYISSSPLATPFDQTPLGWNYPRWVDLSTGASSGIAAALLAEKLNTPVVYSWNLQLQYEFIHNWVLELGYAGSRGVHQLNDQNDYPNIARLASPANPVNGVTTSTTGNALARVPYLGLGTTTADTTTTGDSKYNSLQATVRKNLSHGLMMQAAYAWARGFDTGGSTGSDPAHYDLTQQRFEYGQDGEYHPQRLSVFYSYNLPLADGAGLLKKAFGGWNLSGTTILQDGTPLSVNDPSGGSVYFGQTSSLAEAQFCPGMSAKNVGTSGSMYSKVVSGLSGHNGYINQSAFCPVPTLAAGDTLSGNSGWGIILGPPQKDWDMALEKSTKVGGTAEKGVIIFRAEFFNAFNHPQYSNPNTSVGNTLGQITSTSVNPRILQFALKYKF